MIDKIDLALDKCQRARVVLKGYETQKEVNAIEQNDEELSIRIIAEYLDQAIETLTDGFQLSNVVDTQEKAFPAQTSFAARLRLALAHSGMTQADLAKQIGVSQSTISQVVNGKVSGVCRTSVIAKALGIDRNWLAYGEGEMQPAKFLTHNNEV